jgi:alpha,alpha-trehalase
MRGWKRLAPAVALAMLAPQVAPGADRPLERIRAYIHSSWTVLARTPRELLAAAVDPKSPARGRWPVYYPVAEDGARLARELAARVPAADWKRIELLSLPAGGAPSVPGLLYVPRPYVVPGGRFNEMYGWDSFFILLGLLADGRVQQAKDLTDNALYEVRHYGTILNANRSYYLTRSQPPFLTGMVLRVFKKTGDLAWLRQAWPQIETYYHYWTRGAHRVPTTGLSRYFDAGSGPAPEVVSSELDERGRNHYQRLQEYFRTHTIQDYDVSRFYDRAQDRLLPLFYKADRSMRESGFDPSGRFGPFNLGVLDYNPVCLNSLLYLMEREAAEILGYLGENRKAASWNERAMLRRERVDRYLWDETTGLYADYDFTRGVRRHYPFLTTYFPLWVGLASKQQAQRVAANLPLFEKDGGLQTSCNKTDMQWDAPFGWAPLQLVAVEGLERYGHVADAHRVAVKFLSLVLQEFLEHGAIFEKYDVVSRRSTVSRGIRFGYSSNEIGFGWTNAAFAILLSRLDADEAYRVERDAVAGWLRNRAPAAAH